MGDSFGQGSAPLEKEVLYCAPLHVRFIKTVDAIRYQRGPCSMGIKSQPSLAGAPGSRRLRSELDGPKVGKNRKWR